MKRSEISKVVKEKYEAFRAKKTNQLSNLKATSNSIQAMGEQIHNIGDWAGELFYLGDYDQQGEITDPVLVTGINKTMQAIRENRPPLYSSYDLGDGSEVAYTFIRQHYAQLDEDYPTLILILADGPTTLFRRSNYFHGKK